MLYTYVEYRFPFHSWIYHECPYLRTRLPLTWTTFTFKINQTINDLRNHRNGSSKINKDKSCVYKLLMTCQTLWHCCLLYLILTQGIKVGRQKMTQLKLPFFTFYTENWPSFDEIFVYVLLSIVMCMVLATIFVALWRGLHFMYLYISEVKSTIDFGPTNRPDNYRF